MERLPLEMFETVLMKAFVEKFTEHYRKTVDGAGETAYSALAAVCYNWRQTMNGWPQSPTGHWFRHELKRQINSTCKPFLAHPQLTSNFLVEKQVVGLCQLNSKLYVAFWQTRNIAVFSPQNEKLYDIPLEPSPDHRRSSIVDMVACHDTGRLFIAFFLEGGETQYLARVNVDSMKLTWFGKMRYRHYGIQTLSARFGRLLMTRILASELMLYTWSLRAWKRIRLPDHVSVLTHAVETSRQTFILSHYRITKSKYQISEFDAAGCMVREYCEEAAFIFPYIWLDSDDRMFAVGGGRLLMFNSCMVLERILLDNLRHGDQPPDPHFMRLYGIEKFGRILVAYSEKDSSHIYNIFSYRLR